MKKPSLRFRQVFEHPTHFKVKSPMGNPITIAKSAISPSMQARLRKYADGTTDAPVEPPTPAESVDAVALAKAAGGAGSDFPLPEGMTAPTAPLVFVDPSRTGTEVPIPAVEPAAESAAEPEPLPQFAAFHSDTGRTRPRREAVVTDRTRPRLPIATQTLAAEPAAAPIAPARAAAAETPAVAEAPAPAEAPAAPAEAPAAEQTVEQRIRADVAKAYAERQKEINLERDAALQQANQAKLEADEYQKEHDRWLAKAKASRGIQEQASNDLAAFKNQGSYLSRLSTMSQIGTALSLAAGAFATGMTGMPNFALQIYNNAVEKDLEKQREDRNSLWNQFVQAGNSAEHADQYVRASMDKAVAARAAQQAALTKNATAAQGLAKFAADMNTKAEAEIAKIKKPKLVPKPRLPRRNLLARL